MATDLSERKPPKSLHATAPPPEPEHLSCPRCDSINTKFCYYNNYNFSQPRHFCKSCRRYWTHGGTLRDIPVGGGSRKNSKRSRSSSAAVSPSPTTTAPVFSFPINDFRHFPAGASQFLVPYGGEHGGFVGGDGKMCGSFTSLLSSNQGNGFLGLGGFGPTIDDLGFGLGRAAWPFTGVVEGGSLGSGHTWQVENGQGGFVGGGDCFTLPDLAISTSGTMLK